jgi:hypothetical protein
MTLVLGLARGSKDYLEPDLDDCCGAFCPPAFGLPGWRCTRAFGHDGDHAAHNNPPQQMQLARWPQ